MEFELERDRITLGDIIGEGQFGDVHRGTYSSSDGTPLQVAVKVCKADSEQAVGNKFLEEACMMQQFEHPHIVRLVGVCSKSPIWIVMELAQLGQMRTFLQANRADLKLPTLVLFCYQACSLTTLIVN